METDDGMISTGMNFYSKVVRNGNEGWERVKARVEWRGTLRDRDPSQ